ncbi:MAG: multicopper oxidase domain-containing protein [Gemmatimonadaceae bacterium]
MKAKLTRRRSHAMSAARVAIMTMAISTMVVMAACRTAGDDVARHDRIPTVDEAGALAEHRLLTHTNEQPSGSMKGDTLDVSLEVISGSWFPEAEDGLHETVLAFAERGKAGRVPGPLLRVVRGTTIRASIHNPLPNDTLFVHGFREANTGTFNVLARADTIAPALRVPPGATVTATSAAATAGTYFYWASTDGSTIENRRAIDSQLHGAILVDTATTRATNDRVFVISIWGVPVDSAGPEPWVPRDMMTINGKSWPHTERFDYSVGDTVRWRWINPSIDAHPMHLHGFFFDVTSRGSDFIDTTYNAPDKRTVVTELMLPGGTMAMEFAPQVAGNWLFHCHFTFHVSHYLSFAPIPDDADPGAQAPPNHPHEMRGLALGIIVHDTAGARPARVPAAGMARQVRLVAERDPARYGTREGFVYVLGDSNGHKLPKLSSTIELRRGEPVAITVVNHLRQATAVHWHGIELQDSYVDGVPMWSGSTAKLAPAIAVSDSFVAAFTPPRAGTFIYHSHSNEEHQIGWGLYGALIVRDSGVLRDTLPEHVIVIGSDGPNIQRILINGDSQPVPFLVQSGRTYRLRIVHMNTEMRTYVSLKNGLQLVSWKPVAKDGADLPPGQQRMRPSRVLMGPGETMDVEVTADSLQHVKFEVSSLSGASRTSVAFTVQQQQRKGSAKITVAPLNR